MSNDIAQAEKDIDKAVLELLLHSQQWPWSVEEVGREIGDRLGAEDALSRLARAGLAHRHDEFVFPSRAAIRAVELDIAGR
jgi:predicted transcriptional regulator